MVKTTPRQRLLHSLDRLFTKCSRSVNTRGVIDGEATIEQSAA